MAKIRKKPPVRRRAPLPLDPELHALATVLHALEPLSPEQRARVLEYARRWVEAHAVKR